MANHGRTDVFHYICRLTFYEIKMDMRKLLSVFSLLVITAAVFAVPAKRGLWKMVRLADGTEVKVELKGDEFGHFWQSADGTRYVSDGSANIYKVADMGAISLKAKARRNIAAKARSRRSVMKAPAARAQSYIGTKKGLLILVEFSDKKFKASNDLALYKQVVNGENYSNASLGFRGSVRDYFRDQSDGQFDFDIDVVGPVSLPQKYAYYGANDMTGNDVRAEYMIKEACEKVDGSVDFTKYDWDGDGEVDQVFVLYAGHGEASYDDENTVWPHAWYLKDGAEITLKLDGVLINSYACGSELGSGEAIDGIGTICHEFSHCFGLPDMYDTEYSGNFGMCSWSLMDSGSYNDDGYTPAEYTSYEKMAVGWKQPLELTADMEVANLKPYSDGGDAYIIYNEGNRNEYFLLENRQQTGWDAGLEDKGLLAIHVDYDANVWNMNEVNTTTNTYSGNNHQRCTIIPADGTYNYQSYQGNKYFYAYHDAFPYGSATSITGSTKNATLYNRNADGTYKMGMEVLDITQNADGTVSFNIKERSQGGSTGGDDNTPKDCVFYESFDNCAGTGGNDDLWSGSGVANAKFSPDNTGWSSESSAGANKCAKFGSSKKTGNVTTPQFTVNGSTTFTFLAAPWDKDDTALSLEVSGNATISPMDFTMTEHQWTAFTATITGQGNVSVTFKPGKRLFLDEVKAYVPTSTAVKGIENGTAAKPADSRIYSLDGRCVGTDMGALPHGIYVVGGRKIVK